MSAEYYPVGNQQLDVSRLPEGAYEIEIRVVAEGQVIATETRFFSKSTKLPPVGEHSVGFDVGQLARPLSVGTEPDSKFMKLRYAYRLSDGGYLDFAGQATQHWSSLQGSYRWLRLRFLGEGGFQYASDGYRAAVLSASYKLPFGVFGITWDKAEVPGVPSEEERYFRRFAQDSETASLRYSYSRDRWYLRAFLRSVSNNTGDYFAAAVSTDWLPIAGNRDLRLSGFVEYSEQADFRTSLALRWNIPAGTRNYWIRSRWSDYDDSAFSNSVGMNGFIEGRSNATRKYALALESDDNRKELESEFEYESESMRNIAALDVEIGGNNTRSFSNHFRTSVNVSSEGLRLFGGVAADSGILVSLPSVSESTVVITINETRKVSLKTGSTHFIGLRAYERYRVSVQAAPGSELEYDAQPREVVLYPGHIPVLEWHGVRVVPVFGELKLPDIGGGAEIRVSSDRGLDIGENGGFFALEVSTDAPVLKLSRNDALLCEVPVDIVEDAQVVDLGVVGCH